MSRNQILHDRDRHGGIPGRAVQATPRCMTRSRHVRFWRQVFAEAGHSTDMVQSAAAGCEYVWSGARRCVFLARTALTRYFVRSTIMTEIAPNVIWTHGVRRCPTPPDGVYSIPAFWFRADRRAIRINAYTRSNSSIRGRFAATRGDPYAREPTADTGAQHRNLRCPAT